MYGRGYVCVIVVERDELVYIQDLAGISFRVG